MQKALIVTALAGYAFLSACGEPGSDEEATAALAESDGGTSAGATEDEIDECAAAYRGALQREYDGSGMSEEHLDVLARHDCMIMTPEERTLGLPDRSSSGGSQSGEVAEKPTSKVIGPRNEQQADNPGQLDPNEPACQLGKLDSGSAAVGFGAPVPLAQADALDAQIPALKRKYPGSDFIVMCEGGE